LLFDLIVGWLVILYCKRILVVFSYYCSFCGFELLVLLIGFGFGTDCLDSIAESGERKVAGKERMEASGFGFDLILVGTEFAIIYF